MGYLKKPRFAVDSYNTELWQGDKIVQRATSDAKNRRVFDTKVKEKEIAIGRKYFFNDKMYEVVGLDSPRGVELVEIETGQRIKFNPSSPLFDNPYKD